MLFNSACDSRVSVACHAKKVHATRAVPKAKAAGWAPLGRPSLKIADISVLAGANERRTDSAHLRSRQVPARSGAPLSARLGWQCARSGPPRRPDRSASWPVSADRHGCSTFVVGPQPSARAVCPVRSTEDSGGHARRSRGHREAMTGIGTFTGYVRSGSRTARPQTQHIVQDRPRIEFPSPTGWWHSTVSPTCSEGRSPTAVSSPTS